MAKKMLGPNKKKERAEEDNGLLPSNTTKKLRKTANGMLPSGMRSRDND